MVNLNKYCHPLRLGSGATCGVLFYNQQKKQQNKDLFSCHLLLHVLSLLFLPSFHGGRWMSASDFGVVEFLLKTSGLRIIVLMSNSRKTSECIAWYSQISRPIGIWDYPLEFSAVNIYNSIRTRFRCGKHGSALIWVIFTSHYASIDQISQLWCELIKVARFTNWLYWNKIILTT